jgi:hypothetical protein
MPIFSPVEAVVAAGLLVVAAGVLLVVVVAVVVDLLTLVVVEALFEFVSEPPQADNSNAQQTATNRGTKTLFII